MTKIDGPEGMLMGRPALAHCAVIITKPTTQNVSRLEAGCVGDWAVAYADVLLYLCSNRLRPIGRRIGSLGRCRHTPGLCFGTLWSRRLQLLHPPI